MPGPNWFEITQQLDEDKFERDMKTLEQVKPLGREIQCFHVDQSKEKYIKALERFDEVLKILQENHYQPKYKEWLLHKSAFVWAVQQNNKRTFDLDGISPKLTICHISPEQVPIQCPYLLGLANIPWYYRWATGSMVLWRLDHCWMCYFATGDISYASRILGFGEYFKGCVQEAAVWSYRSIVEDKAHLKPRIDTPMNVIFTNQVD